MSSKNASKEADHRSQTLTREYFTLFGVVPMPHRSFIPYQLRIVADLDWRAA